MSHGHDNFDGDREDPAGGSTWIWMLIFSAALVLTILIVTAVSYNVDSDETERKVIAPDLVEIGELRADQEELLIAEPHLLEYSNEFFERETTLVIPIDRAIDAVAAEIGSGG